MKIGVVVITLLLLVVVALLLLPADFEKPAAPVKAAVVTPKDGCASPYAATSCFDVARGPAPVPLPPVVRRVEPVLPDVARKAGVRGIVILRAGIRRDGTVGGVCVLKPLPCGLTDAAVAAVRQWRFAPQPRDVVANVELRF